MYSFGFHFKPKDIVRVRLPGVYLGMTGEVVRCSIEENNRVGALSDYIITYTLRFREDDALATFRTEDITIARTAKWKKED